MKLVHKITKDKEGLYYTVPFSVPENVVKITVSYDYFKPTKGLLGDLKPSNTVDIGLMDEKGNFLSVQFSHPYKGNRVNVMHMNVRIKK